MLTLPAACATAIVAFAPLFSKRVFGYAQMLLLGAILAPTQRTAACLRVVGLAEEKHFQNYHRVLSRARWSALEGSRILLRQVLDRLLPSGPVIIGLNDTLERRRQEDSSQGHLPRRGTIESWTLRKGHGAALAVADAPERCSLRALAMGIADHDDTGAIGALQSRVWPPTQEAH